MSGFIKCLKIKYDKKGAQTALNGILSHRRHKQRKEIRYYHCPICNYWHLTAEPHKLFPMMHNSEETHASTGLQRNEGEELKRLKEKFGIP